MFNIGFSEVIAIGVIALIVIGPKQLPEVARVVARLMKELKKATQDLSGGLLEVTREVRNQVEDTKAQIKNEGNKIVDSFSLDPYKYDDSHHSLNEEDQHHTSESLSQGASNDPEKASVDLQDSVTSKPSSDGKS